MDIEFKIVRYVNNKDVIWRELRKRLANALVLASNDYRSFLRARLNYWGSVPATNVFEPKNKRSKKPRKWIQVSNYRLRKIHSRVGESPRKQTGNLRESIQVYVNKSILKAAIFTDVPYAQQLEYGGKSEPFDQDAAKKYTNIRLINPIKKVLFIAARPAWRSALGARKQKMFDYFKSIRLPVKV